MTRCQKQLLDFIKIHLEKTGGVSPSFREMARGVGLKSTSDIHRMLDCLKSDGFIDFKNGRARNVRVL